jgi:hypothetical protein
MRVACTWTVLMMLWASTGSAQAPAAQVGAEAPHFRVTVVGYILEDFQARVGSYLALRQTLEAGLPPLVVTDDPADILHAERALAKRIRAARAPVQGQLFTRDIRAEFRRVLRLEVTADTLESITGENPGEFSHDINGTYPKERPLATMPPDILALLPPLPGDINYRFLGRMLVLHDTRANVILDRIPCALVCR